MNIECPCCSSHIWITTEQMANDCIVECRDCNTKIQLEFKYYVITKQLPAAAWWRCGRIGLSECT